MAYTETAVQYPTSAGAGLTYTAAAAAGNKFSNDGRTGLNVRNASGSSITVTITTPGTIDGLAIADKTFTVPATTGDRWWKGDPAVYNQPDGATDAGEVYVDYSAVTSVTIAVMHL